VQHIRQRSAALDGDRHALGEPGDEGQPGRASQAVEGLAHRRAGTHVGQDDAEVAGQLPTAASDDAVEGGDRALTGCHRQGEQFRDDRELRHDLALSRRDLRGEVGVASQHAGCDTHRTQQQ